MNLLLHVCCGPCSLYVIDDIRETFKDCKITGMFANPNIHPYDEFQRRMENAQIALKNKDVPLVCVDDFDMEKWEKYEQDRKSRCKMCYTIRLERVADYAKENGFTHFTTTLLVSPYQDHEMIKEIGERFAEKNDLIFVYRDFSKGFREGQKQAREMRLYRQKYCGCIKSLYEK